jgi:hypothetical protein
VPANLTLFALAFCESGHSPTSNVLEAEFTVLRLHTSDAHPQIARSCIFDQRQESSAGLIHTVHGHRCPVSSVTERDHGRNDSGQIDGAAIVEQNMEFVIANGLAG